MEGRPGSANYSRYAKILAKAGPRGLPIATPSFCWYISLLKLNSIERVAVSIGSMNTSSGNGELLSLLRYKASAHILVVSLKGTFVKTTNVERAHETCFVFDVQVLHEVSEHERILDAMF